MLNKVKEIWQTVQQAIQLDGGTYVDIFAIVFIARLLAPLWGYKPLTLGEASVWGSTIGAFGYSNNRNKPS